MKPPLLDLHAYRTDQVDDAVDQFLMKAQAKGAARAKIMTGKGTGAVQKRVLAYLRMGGFPWEFEKLENGKNNEGVLVVILD